MPVYKYVTLNESGHKVRGQITAANELDLEERLSSIGLDLISYKEVKQAKQSFLGSVTLQDLIVICIHLEQLERAGVPILDAIADLRDTAESIPLKNLMSDIYESVKAGSMLSAAFAEHPKVFNDVFVGLVAAGEKTGNLHEIFFHLARHLKWVNNIKRKIKKAIYYPLFLLFLMSGIVALMMLFVIPKLSSFLTAQDFDLPVYTTSLIATSNAFVEYWYIIFSTPVAIFFFIRLLAKTSDTFAYNLDAFKLMIPYLGNTILKIELARFCHFFSVTFKSGIGILECLDVTIKVAKNKILRENISMVKRSVSEGNSLTASLSISNRFPNLVIRMFKVGEESGNLDSTLENINFFYDREVEDSVNNMVGVIQPMLTIIMGGIMMWVSLAVFGPLYNSFSNMNF